MSHKTSKFSYSIAALTVFALTGCGREKAMTLTQMAGVAGTTMGLGIEVRAADNDKCGKEQFLKIFDDYKALPQADEVRRMVQAKYAKIILEPSNVVQTIKVGKVVKLEYSRCTSTKCDHLVDQETKDLADTRVTVGPNPVTGIEHAQILILKPQATLYTMTSREMYVTHSRTLFESVKTPEDSIFQAALANGEIVVDASRTGSTDGLKCGPLVSLGELL